MSVIDRHPASDVYIEALPANIVGQNLFGVLPTHPRPASKHARATTRLGAQLDDLFDRGRGRGGPGGWIILDDPELHLKDNVVVPDIAGWRRDNLPRLPDTAYFETPPDWIAKSSPRQPPELTARTSW